MEPSEQALFVSPEPAAGRTSRRLRQVVPILWAAFTALFLVVVTQWVQPGFYMIDRSLGAVQVRDMWTVVSAQLDPLVLVGFGFALLFIHVLLSDLRGRSGVLSFAIMFGFAIGLGGVLFSSHSFSLVLGFSFAGMLVADSVSIVSKTRSSLRALVASTCMFLLLPIAVLSTLATIAWLVAGLGGAYPVQLGEWNTVTAELSLLGLAYPVIPWLVLIFLFSWVLTPLILPRFRLTEWPIESQEKVQPQAYFLRQKNQKLSLVLLGLAIVLAVFVRIYAYLPAINPLSLRVGTDAIRGYACWLGLPPAGIPFNECVPSWWNLHIGALWFLQWINVLTGSPDTTLKLAPAVWGILFDLATYVFVKEGTGDSLLAGVSTLFSAVSLDTLVGIDAGILANWLALPGAFLFFAVMLRLFRTRSKIWLVPGLALFVAMFLIHPWTWFLMAVVFAGYLSWDLLRGWRSRTLRQTKLEAVILAFLTATGVIALVAEGLLSHLAGLYAGYQVAIQSVNLSNVPKTLSNLQSSLIQWVGGGETNPVWYLLGTLGVLAIPSLRGRFARLLVVWLAAIAISVPLGDAASLIQERVIFDIPLQIFAAIGAVWIAKYLSQSLRADSLWRWRGHDLVLPLVVVTTTLLSLGFDLEYIGFLFRI